MSGLAVVAAGPLLARWGLRLTTARPDLPPAGPSDPPLPVTVVIPAFDRAELIGRAIRSVQRQTRPPAQVIVVDDASSDGTAEVAAGLGVEVIRLEVNGGAAAARRRGVEAAAHDWVALLDSDDEWLPWMLAALWPQRSGHALVTGGAVAVQDGRVVGRGGLPLGQAAVLDRPELLAWPDNFVPAAGALVHRASLLRAMEAGAPYRYSEDLATWLRLLGTDSAFVLARPIVRYHVHAGQKSASPLRLRDQHAMIEAAISDPRWLARRRRLDRFDRFRPRTVRGARPFLRPSSLFSIAVATLWRKLQRLRLSRSVGARLP